MKFYARQKRKVPDRRGYFGGFGGRFVPETLMNALLELEHAYREARADAAFRSRLRRCLAEFAGRPTPLYYAERLSARTGRKIYLKREDLLHTGAHKINNTVGQALLALRMGKKRVIAETGAGQHGVAAAVAAARFGLKCEIFMGEEDMRRQALNVFRMKLLGAAVTCVTSGSKTLKDATSEAMRNWVTNVENTYYILGSVVGPHPYPLIVRDFQSVIGTETKKQILAAEGRLPDYLVACVGGGSNAIGLFHPFFSVSGVKMIGVEAAGHGLSSGKHAASLCRGRVGILHGNKSYLLQNNDGQVLTAHSVSAGLDYPGVGPEHAYYKSIRRAAYAAVTDKDALYGLKLLSELEGIIPALESAHAAAYVLRNPEKFKKNSRIIICLSGRGDKDVELVSKLDVVR